MVCGKRTKENTEELIQDFANRANDGKPPRLFTTDDYPCYRDALLHVYGEWVFPERTELAPAKAGGSVVAPGIPIRSYLTCSMLQ